ncbi:hypothetical protein IJ541_10180 [bacterium]|nr:hypothetical protein [bacterium]
MKKFVVFFLVVFFSLIPSFALELDLSVDEEIKKKYNSSKLNYDVLPNLPKVDNSQNQAQTSVPKTQPIYSTTVPQITKIDPKDAIKLPKWTKFQVKSNQTISDSLREGTNISFTTTTPVYKKYITVPTGSKLNGIITNSHRAQVTGNGGLVVIKITSLTYNGKTYAVNGKITKANYKKIFLNNIKGKRQYLKGIEKQVNKGENFYKKAKIATNKLSNNPILVVISPIPMVVGVAGYAGATVLSPLTGLTNKGGNLSIPSGSQFEIKLLEDAFIAK